MIQLAALQLSQVGSGDTGTKYLYTAVSGGPDRLVLNPRCRLHIVALGQEPLPQPHALDAIQFRGAGSGPATLSIQGDGSWRLRAPVKLRSGSLAADHPVAAYAVSAPGSGSANRKVRLEAGRDVRLQIAGPLSAAVKPFAISIGGGEVARIPALAVNPQFAVDAAGVVTTTASTQALSTVSATSWSTQALGQGSQPPPPQTIGYGPGGNAWAGHLVYRTAAGAYLHLAP